MARERNSEALTEFRTAERPSPFIDKTIGMRIAEAAYEDNRLKEAAKALDTLPDAVSQSERDRRDFLRGKIAEIDGRVEYALAIYQSIVHRFAGNEVPCRIAAIYINRGNNKEARRNLIEIEQRMKRTPSTMLKADAAMYDWAKRALANLN